MSKEKQFKIMADRQLAIRQKSLQLVDSDPTQAIVLNGKSCLLEYAYGPVTRIFKQTGVNINMTAIAPEHLGDPEVFEPILREGLRIHQPELASDPGLMDMIKMRHMLYYATCIQMALTASEPDPAEIGRILDQFYQEDNPQQELPLAPASTSADSGDGASVVEFVPKM